jgi:asparagine synthase (glutamine-hydrolysing)
MDHPIGGRVSVSGICGVVNLDGSPVEPGVLESMAEAATHRGPDGVRYWRGGNAGLAHLALNLTSEFLREQQLLVDEEGELMLAADARVDNRAQLKRDLGTMDHSLGHDPTDAELILAAYRCWGVDCSAHLIGDFAFAVWDAGKRRLFAARDPMAMRAFYYRIKGNRVLFGTEAKQILAAGEPARLFEPAVGAHLAGCFGPLEWSFYEGISQLPPAHALSVEAGRVRVWRYWDVDPERYIRYADEQEYVEHFLEVFGEAVRCRLRSVKPVGLFLSGGVDSGSIASMIGWLMREGEVSLPEFRTYSWAFEELKECDERHISEGIVRHYGFPATDIPADDAWPLKDYPAHGPDRDEPLIWIYEPLIERTLSVARSEGMGLMLSGDRGDEMVGGGIIDPLGLLRARRWLSLWDELRAYSHRSGLSLRWSMISQLLKPYLLSRWPGGGGWVLETYRKLRRSGTPGLYPDWVSSEFAGRIGLDEIVRQHKEPQPTGHDYPWRTRYQWVFLFQQMQGMVWSDRTYAHFDQEFADPWSDRRLAEFILAVPQWRIQRQDEPKLIARQAMRGVMPEIVRRSVRKIYLSPLGDRALKERSKDIILELIEGSRAAALGYLEEDALRNSYLSFLRGEPFRSTVWYALQIEMWLRRYWC